MPVYDLLNRILSLGLDQSWRRRAATKARGRILDLACGTGDLAIALRDRGRVCGSDILPEMLARAAIKSRGQIPFIAARGEALPFRAEIFDTVTIAFGIRNFSDRRAGLAEARRVLGADGQLIILEFAIPDNAVFRRLYLFYFLKVLPFVGRVISRNEVSYSYLPDSVLKFPSPTEFAREIEEAGFLPPAMESLTFGIVRLYAASACSSSRQTTKTR